MKGIFWNSRGLADLAKYQYISDAVKEHNLDFIAVMKTGKQDMSKTSLNRLSGGADFVWHCLPPKGRYEGILLGVNATVLELSIVVEGEFYIKFHLCNKIDNFKWILMAIYGPVQDSFKTAFLSELVRACQQNHLPTIIGGGGILTLCDTVKRKIMIDLTTIGLSCSMQSSIALTYEKLS
jgi:hypothetical protein